MAAQRFDVSILLNVVTEGIGQVNDFINTFKELRTEINKKINAEEAFLSLGKNTEVAEKAIKRLKSELGTLSKFQVKLSADIGGLDSLTRANDILKKLRSEKPVDLRVITNAEANVAELKILASTFTQIQKQAEKDNRIQIFEDASAAIKDIESLKNELNRLIKVRNDFSRNPIQLSTVITEEFNKAKSELNTLKKDLAQAKKDGASVDIKVKAQGDIQKIINDLQRLLKEKIALGEDPVAINLQLFGAETLQREISKIDSALDAETRKNRLIKIGLEKDIQSIGKEAASLANDVQKAITEKDFRVTPKLQIRQEQLQTELAKVEAAAKRTNNNSLLRLIDSKTVDLSRIAPQLRRLDALAPKGISRVINNLGNSVTGLVSTVGGSKTVLTAFGSTVRTMGTAAFLVGGEFRTLGFGLSALGSTIQNVLPLFLRIASSLGIIGGPIALGAVAGIVILTTKILAFGAGMAAVIKTGIEFNSLFENTQNTIAALTAEFFKISRDGIEVGSGLEEGAKAIAKFTATSKVAEEQLQALALEAATSIFTTQELFSAFQAVTVALGPLAGSLENARRLTGEFARAAAIARIPAAQLGTAIQTIISGRARNNRLQALLNDLKDSEGIALTSKRIKELRAAGGTKLVDELSEALHRLTAASGAATAQSFTGVISNLQDLFDLISGNATKGLFDAIKVGLGGTIVEVDGIIKKTSKGIIDQILTTEVAASTSVKSLDAKSKAAGKSLTKNLSEESQKAGETVKSNLDKSVAGVEFTPKVKKLIEQLTPLLTKLGQDLVSLFGKLVNYLISFGEYLEANRGQIIKIYEAVKQIVTSIIRIYDTLVALANPLDKSHGSIRIMASLLNLVAHVTQAISQTWASIVYLIASAGRLSTKLAKATNPFVKYGLPGGEELGRQFDANEKSFSDSQNEIYNIITKNSEAFANYKKSINEFGNTNFDKAAKAKEILSKINEGNSTADISNKRIRALSEAGLNKEEITKFSGFSKEQVNKALDYELSALTGHLTNQENAKNKSARDTSKSLLEATKALNDAELDLVRQKLDNEFELVRGNIELQKSLIQDLVDYRLVTEENAAAAIARLREQEIQNEIVKRTAAIKEIQAKRQQDQKAANDAIAKLQAEQARLPAKNRRPNNTDSRVDDIRLKDKTNEIKSNTDILKLTGELSKLDRDRLDIARDLVKTQTQRLLQIDAEVKKTRNSITNLTAPNSAQSFKSNSGKIIQDALPELQTLRNEIDSLDEKTFAIFGPEKAKQLFKLRKAQSRELLRLKQQEVDLLIKEEASRTLNAASEKELNTLRFQEENIQRQIANGVITEQEGTIRITAARQNLIPVLQRVLDEQKKLESAGLANPEQIARIRELESTIQEFSTTVTESDLLQATNDIRDSFVDFFDTIQENAGNASSAFADLGKSILKTFRRLLSEQIVKEFFSTFFPTEGQTQGKAGGLFADVLRKLGLGRQAGADTQVAAVKAETTPNTAQTDAVVTSVSQRLAIEGNGFVATIADIDAASKKFYDLLGFTASEIQKLGLSTAEVALKIQNIVGNATGINNKVNDFNIEKTSTNTSELVQLLNQLLPIVQSIAQQSSAEGLSQIQLPQGDFEEFRTGGMAKRRGLGYLSGGAVNGYGDLLGDAIPAYLSNGEFVLNAKAVKALGLDTVEKLNNAPKLAGGGFLKNYGSEDYIKPLIDATKFDYSGGGASLRNLPAPIVEQVVQPKKKSKFKSILGNILSFAAPFLNFIPGVGPFLSLAAGAAGGALTGAEKGLKGGILGGLFGGLSNLGGFAGSSGFLGSLSKGLSSGAGQGGLSLFGGLLGNTGGNISKSLNLDSTGSGGLSGILGSLKGLGSGFGGLGNLFKGAGGSGGLSSLFKGFGGLSGILGKLKGLLNFKGFAEGGKVDGKTLALLFTLFTSLSKFGQPKPEAAVSSEFADPDQARKDKYGPAYDQLIEAGVIPDFQYSQESLDKLTGAVPRTNPNPKKGGFLSGILGFLGSVLPLLLTFLSKSGSGKFKGLVDSPLPSSNGNVYAAKGGLIKAFASGGKVKGPGSSKSDSIFAMLSNGEYVINADAVKLLGTGLLDSLNSGRTKFAEGGIVGDAGIALPQLAPTNPNVAVDGTTNIYNYVDRDELVGGYINNSNGQRNILNFIGRNSKAIKGLLNK